MSLTLSPSCVLITGANRGIGLEFVKQFLDLPTPPDHVFASCRSPESAKELQDLASNHYNLTIVQLDVTDGSSIEDAKKDVSKIVGQKGLSLLINNAGVANKLSDDLLRTVTAERMVDLFKVNTVGSLMVIKAFLPLLQKAARSRGDFSINEAAIVNISSGVGSITNNDKGTGYAYRTSKAGLNMITKNLSIDLQPFGIIVTAIHPGWVQTDMGGPKATESAKTCVSRMMDVMATLQGEDQTGLFYHNEGYVIPW